MLKAIVHDLRMAVMFEWGAFGKKVICFLCLNRYKLTGIRFGSKFRLYTKVIIPYLIYTKLVIPHVAHNIALAFA